MKTDIMRAVASTVLAACLSAIPVRAQSLSQTEAILSFSGASALEDLEESEYERLESLLHHPLEINLASISEMTESGVLSPFQAASVADYRKSSGDILSLMELSVVDGFSEETVRRLSPFVSLRSASNAGWSSADRKTRNELQAKTSMRKDGSKAPSASWAAKYRLSGEGRYSICAAARSSYDAEGMGPDTWSLSVTKYGKSGKVTVGDFNARFGQGLCLWSGFSLSGVSGTDAMRRRSGGISPAWTYGNTHLRGAAFEHSAKGTRISLMAATDILERHSGKGWVMPAANISHCWRRFEAGVTAWWRTDGNGAASADIGWNVGSVDIFAEAAADLSTFATAALAGAVWSPAWQRKYSVLLRAYPSTFGGVNSGAVRTGSRASGEYALALGTKQKWLDLTADAAWFPAKGYGQIKAVGKAGIKVSDRLSMVPRASVRLRKGDSRADARADLIWTDGKWTAIWRSNAVHSVGWGQLHYAEVGYKGDGLTAWARVSGFVADRWDDRVYAYERDAPGNFNVPAYYGRGVAGSLVAGYRKRRSSLYLRSSYIHYFSGKPARVEIRLQYGLSL